MISAICLVTLVPNEIYLDFLNKFKNYDIYVIIDDNTFNTATVKIKYPKINFIQLDNNKCTVSGYTNLNFITLNKPVCGWCKSLYFFSYINTIYDFVWFIEDDIFFYDETTLINIDNTYVKEDLLCNSSFEEANLNEWLWNRIHINLTPPYYCGMMCITRFSIRMLDSIKDYASKNNSLFFLEALYPTIAIKYNLSYISNPTEFLTVVYKHDRNHEYDITMLNKTNLYHPMKKMENHIKTRIFMLHN
jgi:hypothetical protein